MYAAKLPHSLSDLGATRASKLAGDPSDCAASLTVTEVMAIAESAAAAKITAESFTAGRC